MIRTINRVYLRSYRDNRQRTVYVEFIDGRGRPSRLECAAEKAHGNAHMQAVLRRARHEGLALEHEAW